MDCARIIGHLGSPQAVSVRNEGHGRIAVAVAARLAGRHHQGFDVGAGKILPDSSNCRIYSGWRCIVDCFEGHDNFHAAEVDCGKDDHFFHSSYYRVSENHQSCLSHYQKYFLVHQCRYGVDLLGHRCRASSHVRTRGIVIRPLGGDSVGAAVQRSYSTGADARRSTLRLWAAVSGERRVLPVTTFFADNLGVHFTIQHGTMSAWRSNP